VVYAPHIRLTAGGALGADLSQSIEEWSCTINVLLNEGDDLSQATADNAFAYWASLITAPAMHFSTATHLMYAKAALVDASGHIPGVVYRHDGDVQGGDPGCLPWQDTIVVSLRTGLRGPSHRGRFYLPPQILTVNLNTGGIDAEDRDAMYGPLTLFLNGLGEAIGLVQVASSKGYNTQVTGYDVGLIIDTQRRRRRSLNEAYGDVQALA